MVVENLSSQRSGLVSRNGAVRLNIKNQFIKVCLLTYTGVLYGVIHLEHRGVDRVDCNGADGQIHQLLVAVTGHIAAAAVCRQLHRYAGAGVQISNVQLGIQDLYICVMNNIARSDLAFSAGLNVQHLRLLIVNLQDNVLEIQNDLRHIFLYMRNGRKLVQHTINLHGSDGIAGQRGEQHSPHTVAQGCAETSFQRFHHKLTYASASLSR